jgi:hypothetical protein
MPITAHIDKAKDFTVFKVTGVLSFDEVLPVVKDFYDGDPTKHVLWDMTDTTEVQLTSEEVETLANFSPRYEGKRASGKTAIVAQKDIIFGLSRMFEFQSSSQQAPFSIMVFRSIEEAHQWLDEAQ